MIGWLVGSKLGRGIGAALALMLGFVGLKRHIRKELTQEARVADYENAKDIRNRARDARGRFVRPEDIKYKD